MHQSRLGKTPVGFFYGKEKIMREKKTANERLLEKMRAEYEAFLDYLRGLPVEQLLDRAYEKVMKEDIVYAIEEEPLSEKQARALLKTSHPLEECYSQWQKSEGSYMPDLRAAIEYRAGTLENRSREREAR